MCVRRTLPRCESPLRVDTVEKDFVRVSDNIDFLIPQLHFAVPLRQLDLSIQAASPLGRSATSGLINSSQSKSGDLRITDEQSLHLRIFTNFTAPIGTARSS